LIIQRSTNRMEGRKFKLRFSPRAVPLSFANFVYFAPISPLTTFIIVVHGLGKRLYVSRQRDVATFLEIYLQKREKSKNWKQLQELRVSIRRGDKVSAQKRIQKHPLKFETHKTRQAPPFR
jgi:hypothetical protein